MTRPQQLATANLRFSEDGAYEGSKIFPSEVSRLESKCRKNLLPFV